MGSPFPFNHTNNQEPIGCHCRSLQSKLKFSLGGDLKRATEMTWDGFLGRGGRINHLVVNTAPYLGTPFSIIPPL